MRDTFNSKEREYKRLSKIAYSNWGQGGVCVVLLVFYPLPAVVVFEVQRECLKGRGGSTPSPAGTSGLAKADTLSYYTPRGDLLRSVPFFLCVTL